MNDESVEQEETTVTTPLKAKLKAKTAVPVKEDKPPKERKPSVKKTVCPLTRAEFEEHAKDLKIEVAGRTFLIEKKMFSTGSFGFFMNDKIPIEIDGKKVVLQGNINLIVVGSKEVE